MITTVYDVVGMTCGHCASAVSVEVGEVASVTDVRVDLAAGRVSVTGEGPFDDAAVRAAVAAAEYKVVGP